METSFEQPNSSFSKEVEEAANVALENLKVKYVHHCLLTQILVKAMDSKHPVIERAGYFSVIFPS